MKKSIVQLLSLILICSFVMLLTACPKETAVRRSVKASYELSGLTVDVINATGKAYANGLISLETKDKLADSLKILSVGGKRFNQALDLVIRESGGDETKVPMDKIQMLNKLFSDEVVAPFLQVLQSLKLLSPEKARQLHITIAALRTAVLTISLSFQSVAAERKFIGEVNVYA